MAIRTESRIRPDGADGMIKQKVSYRSFDYNRSQLPNAYLSQLESGVENIDQAIPRTGYTIGYPGWGMLYHTVLCSLKPGSINNVIETGTNLGCSTIILAQAIVDSRHDGRVYSIEIDTENHTRAQQNIDLAGVSGVTTLIHGDSRQVLAGLKEQLDSVRVAFLDGSHKCDDVFAEFELLYPLFDKRSIVIFDNARRTARMNKDQKVHGALKIIKKRYGGNIIHLPYVSWQTPGLSIWQKNPF